MYASQYILYYMLFIKTFQMGAQSINRKKYKNKIKV